MNAAGNELMSISELLLEVKTLVHVLYGTPEHAGIISDIQTTNEEFNARIDKLRELLELAAQQLGGAFGEHAEKMATQLEQLCEITDLLNIQADRFDPSVFADACIYFLKPQFIEPLARTLEEKTASAISAMGETIVATINKQLKVAANDAIVIRRDELVAEIIATVRGEFNEISATRELVAMQKRYEAKVTMAMVNGGIAVVLAVILISSWLL